MGLKYVLIENKLTKEIQDDYVATPLAMKVNGYKDLEKEIACPGSILKPTEIRAVIDNYWNAIANIASKGEAYRDEYVTVKLSMTGIYAGNKDRFDRSRHQVVVSLLPGNLLKEAANTVKPEYVEAEAKWPNIESVVDWGSDTVNQNLTPGNALEIKGQELKIYDHVEGQGVFFINQNTGQETLASRFHTNEPNTLLLMVPELVSGNYRIEVRNSTRKGKDLRTGLCFTLFKVA